MGRCEPADRIDEHHDRERDRNQKHEVLGGDRAEIDGLDVGLVLMIVRVVAAGVRVRRVRCARVAVIVDVHVQTAELGPDEAQASQQYEWQCQMTAHVGQYSAATSR